MIRTLRRICILLIWALSTFLAACAMPPPAQEIGPQVTVWAKHTQLLREKQGAERLIYWISEFLDKEGTKVGGTLRRDITALVEGLRKALEANDVAKISTSAMPLKERQALLMYTSDYVKSAPKILSNIGDDLSPSRRAEVEAAILAYQRALEGDSWDEVRGTGNALIHWYAYRLEFLKQFWEKNASLEKLGNKVSPALRQEIHTATEPMRHAMKFGTWDEIVKQEQQLPPFVSYPQQIVWYIDGGTRAMEVLGPSERQYMLPLFAALDIALRGERWNQALAAAAEIVAAPRRKFGPMDWAPCIRILSIDGGGVRGIIPAMMLAELERRMKTPIAELFDYVVGTSTGGILALGLTVPHPDNPRVPRYTAQKIVDTYESEARTIFPSNPFKGVGGIAGPKYSPKSIEQVLKDKFGNARVADSLTNVMIPAYALETRERFVFSNQRETSLFYMRDAARATSAAPTYFPPFRFRIPRPPPERDRSDAQSTPEKTTYLSLIDGGVFANNPTVYGLAVIRRGEELRLNSGRYGDKRPWLLLSLGTGQVPPSASIENVENAWRWGSLEWVAPLVDIVFSESGIGDEPGGKSLFTGFGDYYFRLQPQTLSDAAADLDNASPANIRELQQVASEYIKRESNTLDELVSRLRRERPRECQRLVGP